MHGLSRWSCGWEGRARGGGGDETGTDGDRRRLDGGDAPAPRQNPTIHEPGAAEAASNVDKVRAALDAAGYTVEDEDVSGTATNSLRVGDTSIVFYRSTADASADYAGIKGAFKDNPGRGSARIKDTRVYYVGQGSTLTATRRADFLKIVPQPKAAL